jgi:hypothetical protein
MKANNALFVSNLTNLPRALDNVASQRPREGPFNWSKVQFRRNAAPPPSFDRRSVLRTGYRCVRIPT